MNWDNFWNNVFNLWWAFGVIGVAIGTIFEWYK